MTAASNDFVPYQAAAAEAGRSCAICQTRFAAGETVGPCPSCAAVYHRECWTENGGCAAYGCDRMPATVKPDENASPRSFWGQDEKTCPQCAEKIKVAAVRCRFCGASFDTAAPVTRRDLRQKEESEKRRSSLKTASLWLFICGIIPCLAPLTAIIGGAWFMGHRRDIAKLPSINRVYCYAGLIASVVSTALMTTVLIFVAAS